MKKIFFIIFITAFNIAYGQSIPLDQQVQKRFNEITLDADTAFFTGFRSVDWLEYKPFLSKQKTQVTDSAFGIGSAAGGGYWFKNLAADNWIKAGNNTSVFTIDPYIDGNLGKEKEQTQGLYQASAGLRVQGTVNNKLSFSLGYVYTSQRFANYVDSFITDTSIGGAGYGPGTGKATAGRNGAYGFSQFTGYVTYVPNTHILISAGNGKNFIGDGYRSLLLSDNSANYPYVRLQARYWRITYNVLYAEMSNPRYTSTSPHKYYVTHYLGFNFSRKFQIGLFDNIVFSGRDTNITRGFDVQYLNPIIYSHPIEYSIGNPDKALIGFTAKYQVYKKGFLYGQIAVGDLHIQNSFKEHTNFWANKYALQAGIWNEDIFGAKGLAWRLEFNSVRPFMYDHGFGRPGINYTNANQVLTDPFDANFNEGISILQYNYKRWYGSLENLITVRGEQKGNTAISGLTNPVGDNPWAGDNTNNVQGSKTMQGIKNYYYYNQATVGFLINPRNRLAVEASAVYRHHDAPGISQTDVLVNFGIKMGLYNFYKDF